MALSAGPRFRGRSGGSRHRICPVLGGGPARRLGRMGSLESPGPLLVPGRNPLDRRVLIAGHHAPPRLSPAALRQRGRCWTYLKSDTPHGPIAIAFLFTFATAGVLFCSLALLRGRSQGLIAVTVLLATPFFLVLGSSQYADVPLAFFFLSTIVLLCLHEHL